MTIFGNMSLGELIGELQKRPKDDRVQFDFCGAHPTDLDSYRGFYDHLSFGWAVEDDHDEPRIEEVLGWLLCALEKPFTGYKGGTYYMTRETPLWVANYGRSHSTGVVGVLGTDYGWTFLTTARLEV